MRSEGLFFPFGAQHFFVNFPCIRFELAPVAMLQQHVHMVVTAQLSYKRMHITCLTYAIRSVAVPSSPTRNFVLCNSKGTGIRNHFISAQLPRD
jgi:hypothetical protein